MNSESRPLRVLLVCPGLDHAHRGFESFARECFTALRDEEGISIELIKGSGPAGPGERSIPTLERDHPVAQAAGRAVRRRPFVVEHATFSLALQPVLLRRRPDLVYFSEWHVGRILSLTRRITRQRYRLLLCNGTMADRGFEHLDHVQELTPAALDWVLERGADPQAHTMLPLGFFIERVLEPPTRDEVDGLRASLGLPLGRRILISVAALNRHHKRLDYVIEDLASMPEPRPFLLLAGQPDEETAGLRSLARARLGEGGHSIRTVPSDQVGQLLRASDAFVLASLYEGLPRALVEAMAQGLPCLTHDYPVTRFALGPYGQMADFTRPGGLAGLLGSMAEVEFDPARRVERHSFAYERFGWDRLRPGYLELFRTVAGE